MTTAECVVFCAFVYALVRYLPRHPNDNEAFKKRIMAYLIEQRKKKS